MKRKILSTLLTLCMVLALVPTTAFAEGETSGTPSVSAYATKEQMMDDTFAPKSSWSEPNIGKLAFGKEARGYFSLEWYILGKDSGVTKGTDNTVIFAVSSLIGKEQFFSYSQDKTMMYSENWKCTYPSDKTISEVNKNHYGGSDLRVALQSMATTNFTKAEQDMMNDTTIETYDSKNNVYYTTTDKLYALTADRLEINSIKAGSNNDKVLYQNHYWNTGDSEFWLRTPSLSAASAMIADPPKQFVNTYWGINLFGMRPAGNLNLSSVLFASSATVASSGTAESGTIADGKAMTLRLDGTGKNIGTVKYNTTTGDIKTTKGSTEGLVELVVQGRGTVNGEEKDWYYSKQITGTETVNVSDIVSEPNTPASVDLSSSKIWLETADTDGMIYAVKAIEEIPTVAITDIAEPSLNTALDTEASCATTGVSSTTPQITWTPSDTTAGYNTSYTASITLTADTGYEFTDSTTATVLGNSATSVTKNADGTLTVTYAFPEIPDTVDPVISGVENGKTYCSAQTVTVSDNDAIEKVTVNGAEVTLDENNQFTLSPAPGEQKIIATDKSDNPAEVTVTVNDGHTYGEWQSYGNNTHTRYCTVTDCDGYEDGDCEGGEASYFKKAVCQYCNEEYGNLLTDTTAPSGEISIDANKWNSFLNTITFGLFFKDTQSVTITASDDSYSHYGYTDDEAVKVEYYLYSGDTALTKEDLASKEFTIYDGGFNINPDNKYVVYARLTDHAGNVTYISSNGIVLDSVVPVISGIENGKTYCEEQTVTVTEEYIKSVTVNGTEVTLDENNQFTLSPAEGTQTIVITDKAGNETSVTVTVNDGHTAGNDDGDCSTPVYCIYHPDTVVVAAKSHDFSGEWNKDEDGHWHICQNAGCTVAEAKAHHSGTDDGDCTTAVVCECGYVITAANAKHTYGEWQSNSDDTHTRYCTVEGCNGYEDGNCEGGQASCFNKAVCDTCHAEYGALLTDSTAPTGEITVGTNKWNSFLNTITFGVFFKDTQSVTITASDDSYSHAGYTDDKAVKVAYYLHSGDTVLTKEDLASKEFTIYDGGFNINPDNKYVVYARLTDHAGNVTYISSNGIVLDSVVPVISGIENGKTYCEEQTFTVSEKYIKSVTVNGTEVTLDENNQFTLSPAEGTQTIVITDKAGNVSAETTVTVNDGHTAGNDDGNCSTPVYCIYHPDTVVVAAKSHDFSGEWQKNGTDHWHICQNDGCTVAETETPHSCTDDGDCTTAVVCECGYVITAANAKHTYGEWQSNSDDTHTRYCTVEGCNGYEDGNCAGGEATCVAKAVCDTCKAEYGEIDSANHNLEKIPAKDATVTETGNTEYWHCQDCGKYFADENGTKEIKLEDTIISKLSPEIIEGKGQSITAGEKKELIFKSNAAFSDFIRVELDGKTLDEKNYTVKEDSTVVTLKADYVATLSAGEHTIGIVSESGTATTTFTVNAKAVVDNDTKSPQTGDNSHMALWIALLFMSGAGVIGTMVYGKKKRAK